MSAAWAQPPGEKYRRGFSISISSICVDATPASRKAGRMLFEMWR